jgi:uncharacterized membrane protein
MTILKDPPSPRPTQGLEPVVAPSTLDAGGTRLPERAAWTLVWFGTLAGGISLWHFWWHSPFVAALGPVVIAVALAGMAACWLVASPRARAFQAVAVGTAAVAVAVPQAIVIATRAFYVTDSAAFDQVATRALLHGANPYTVSMSAVRHLVSVPNRYWTYTIDGGHVAHTSYPAGSFLFNVPAMALGMTHNVVDFVDLAAWVATALLVFALVPASLRWMAGLLLLAPVLVSMGTDATFLPFLVLAMWRWDRYGIAGAGPARWVGPVALGLACATKQTPWFFVPFLAIGVTIEARRGGRAWATVALRYLATVIAVFAAVNLPFALWDPAAWAHGTLTPLVDPLVADGQGVVSLATHGLTGGVSLTWLAAAGALAYVTTVVAFGAWYPALKRVWPLLLPVAFFFATRSLSSYLVDLLPVAMVAATTVAAASGAAPAPVWHVRSVRVPRAVVVAVPALGVVLASALAFSSAPLELSVRSVTTASAGRLLDTVTVWVGNDTGATVTPHFMVNTGNNPNGFLTPVGGRSVVLGPHRSATVTLLAPARTVAPQDGARWLVEAYTVRPAALSTSSLVVWSGSPTASP